MSSAEIVVGVDETNYSPSAAGACVVCALGFREGTPEEVELRDSKQTTRNQRIEVLSKIRDVAIFSVIPATVSDIGHFGIYTARNVAAKSAVHSVDEKLEALGLRLGRIYTDLGMRKVALGPACEDLHESIKDADARVPEVMAASMIAKTYLDWIFDGQARDWPSYGFEHNHGSVGDQHREALLEHGPCPAHRTTNYAPEWWPKLLGEEVDR